MKNFPWGYINFVEAEVKDKKKKTTLTLVLLSVFERSMF